MTNRTRKIPGSNYTEQHLLDAEEVARAQWEAAMGETDGRRQAAIDLLSEQARQARDVGQHGYAAVFVGAICYGDTEHDGLRENEAIMVANGVCIRAGCTELRTQSGDLECFAHHYEPWGQAYQDERAGHPGY